MFKRMIALALALCLLLTASVAFMEEGGDIEILAAQEAAAELMEAAVEDAELELGEDALAEAPADEIQPIEEVAEATSEETAEAEAPGAETDGQPEEIGTPAEIETTIEAETPAEVETPAEAEIPVETEAPAEAEAPVEAQPVVVEESADTAAKAVNAEAMLEGGTTEIVLTKNTKYTATMGDFLQLNLGGVAATFKSSKKKVATVDANGLIACVGGGKTTITATISKKNKIKLTLTVVDPTIPTAVYLSVDGAAVSGTITAAKGVPFVLTPAATPEGTAVTNYKWSSSKKKIATVNGAGLVTPKKVGTTKITVKTTRGGKKRSIKVKVIDPYKATAVYLDKTGLVYMTAKSTMQLTAAMTTASGEPSTSTLKWSSSNKKIATVNKYGLVTAKKKGTVKITVKTSSGKKRSVKIKVFAQAGAAKSMTGEWVSLAEDNTLNPGDLYTYVVSTNPLNATANVVWSTDNDAVIRVENSYRGDDLKFLAEVRAVDLGHATLTATDTVTGFTQSVVLYVKPGSAPTSISFPNLNNADMSVGEKRDILYQIDPQDSLSHEANHAVVSYDESILSITYDPNNADRNCRGTMDYYLHITAKAAGTTTVTVTLRNGVKNSFEITVR